MTAVPKPTPRVPAIQCIHSILLFLFLIAAAACLCAFLHPTPFVNARLLEALLLVLALTTTLVSLARTLPLQNVLWAAALIFLISELAQAVGDKTGIPFGLYFYTGNMGLQLFKVLPWPVPLLWIVVLLNSRGVAQLMLRPWRKMENYGYGVLGLTCLLAAAFDLALDPFASRINHFWIWQTPQNVPAWYSAPWINFPSRAVITLLILAFITPWMINKKSGPQPQPGHDPLIVWLSLCGLLAVANFQHHLWWAAGLPVMVGSIVAFCAHRSAQS